MIDTVLWCVFCAKKKLFRPIALIGNIKKMGGSTENSVRFFRRKKISKNLHASALSKKICLVSPSLRFSATPFFNRHRQWKRSILQNNKTKILTSKKKWAEKFHSLTKWPGFDTFRAFVPSGCGLIDIIQWKSHPYCFIAMLRGTIAATLFASENRGVVSERRRGPLDVVIERHPGGWGGRQAIRSRAPSISRNGLIYASWVRQWGEIHMCGIFGILYILGFSNKPHGYQFGLQNK